MSNEDCECKIENNKNKNNEIDPNGVGEEIFKDEDIFESVKNFFSRETVEDLSQDEDDYLLEDKYVEEEPDKRVLTFLEELEKNLNIRIVIDKNEKVEKVEKETASNYLNETKTKKLNYIKDYLKRLKNGH